MSWLIFLFAFELGMVTDNGWVMYDPPFSFIESTPHYYTELEVEAEAFEHIFVGGSTKTRMYNDAHDLTFFPFTDEYRFRAGIRFAPIEIGFRHLCTHPVVPYIATEAPPEINYEGSYNEFYIRMEVKR